MVQASPYLQEHVGMAVANSLRALSVTQPSDAVEFVGKYLKGYVASERAKKQIEKDDARVIKARADYQVRKTKEESSKRAAEEAVQKVQAKNEEVLAFLETAEAWTATQWQEIMKSCKDTLGAQNASFGSLEEGVEEGELNTISFTAVSGDQSVLLKQLKQGTGVTWKCLEEHAQPEGYEGDDWKKYKPYYLEDVTKDPDGQAHFFKWAQIGSFVAFPIIYESYLTQEAVEASRTFDTTPKEEPAEDEEPHEPPQKVLPSINKKFVMTFDTLTTFDTFSPQVIAKVEKLLDVAAQAKSRSEFNLVCTQTARDGNAELRAEKVEAYEAQRQLVNENEEYSIQKKVEQHATNNEGAAMPEAEKAIVEVKLSMMKDLLVCKAISNDVKEDINTRAVVPESIVQIICAAALLCGYSAKETHDGLPPKVNSEKAKNLVNSGLLEQIYEKGAFDNLRGPRKGLEKPYQKLEYIKGLLPPAPSEDDEGRGCDFFYAPLWGWLHKAIEARSQDVLKRKAAAEVPAATGEEGEEGAAKPEVNLAELDDDFVE
eukprot:GEMP01032016.1.p1 GENE.GEMP01032016.1~~GEMP01032016.1.p1  ORF type:complete len:543 (+),score=165.25 GEMP01032016.1:83-1711(+)